MIQARFLWDILRHVSQRFVLRWALEAAFSFVRQTALLSASTWWLPFQQGA